MPEYMLITLTVVESIQDMDLGRFRISDGKAAYFQRSPHGTKYVGTFKSDRNAKAVWHGLLRAEGVLA